jgi:lipopolysaccharide/colanic/teichoic acid biosynthesis glycosyltransferase
VKKSKRFFDIILAIFGLVLSVPVWILIIFLIWLEDGRPIFCIQPRTGKDGKIFKGYKFRSMKKEYLAQVSAQAAEDDHRITRFGSFLRKTALDELPQLINILKAEMTFVGPRTLLAFEIEIYPSNINDIRLEKGLFRERSKVAPGLTGLAQVLLTRDAPKIEKFKYDLCYIENRTIFLDIYLVAISILIALSGKWEIRKDKLPHLTGRLKRETSETLR